MAFQISLFDIDQVEQFDEPDATIKTGGPDNAKLEFESIPSKIFTLYDKSHSKAADEKNVSNTTQLIKLVRSKK